MGTTPTVFLPKFRVIDHDGAKLAIDPTGAKHNFAAAGRAQLLTRPAPLSLP
jgi:hypothetical protein